MTITLGADDATALAIGAFVLSLSRQKDNETALDLFERALALSPSCTLAFGYGATSLVTAGKTELAVERARLAVRLNPSPELGALRFRFFLRWDQFRYTPPTHR